MLDLWYGLDRAAPDMFNLLRNDLFFGPRARTEQAAPTPRLYDEGEVLVLSMDVPGLSRDDLDITVLGRRLTVKGERKVAAPEGYQALRQERSAWRFARTWSLPVPVNSETAEASLDNGVLTVRMPKAAEARPHRITVRGA